MVEPDQPGFFTGMSLVNVSDEFGEISITNASTGVSTQITLQPRSKFLSLVDVLVSITSYQTPLIISADIDISVLALRGSIPGGANPILYHIDTEPLDE